MGGKLSSPNSPSASRSGTMAERPPAPSGLSSTSSRSASLSVGSVGHNHRRPVFHFDPALLADNPAALESFRMGRANSTFEGGLQIPRTNYRWLYANQLPDSDSSPEGDAGSSRRIPFHARANVSRSLPHYLISNVRDSKCPLCGKMIPAEDVEVHFVMCLTKPRVTYNEDVWSSGSEECAICLEEMEEGDQIARLPCLCVYHKTCIDQWFTKSQTCPEHPPD